MSLRRVLLGMSMRLTKSILGIFMYLLNIIPSVRRKLNPTRKNSLLYRRSCMGINTNQRKSLYCSRLIRGSYIVEGRMLDWYLAHGMKLKVSVEYPTGIRKKLLYLKSTWLKQYIDFNQCEKR